MVKKSVILLFLDGVGLGDADPEVNPFMHVELPAVQKLLGISHVTREQAGTTTHQATLLGLDALLDVPGLPQSATGQTTILTGQNAAAALGEHYGPYPNQQLRNLLTHDSLFRTLLDAGQPVAYANAYPDRFLDRARRGKGRLSANTNAAAMAAWDGTRLPGEAAVAALGKIGGAESIKLLVETRTKVIRSFDSQLQMRTFDVPKT